MPKKLKDTDYLFLSAYLRAQEGRLLTRERRLRMLDAKSPEDAAKVLSECGYEGLEPLTAQTLEESLRAKRDAVFSELLELSPRRELVELFQIKYDYHNAKAIVKCAATGEDPGRMLSGAGRVAPALLREGLDTGEWDEAVPAPLGKAIAAARELLEDTHDPRQSDFQLDRACFAEQTRLAKDSRSEFLQGYVRLTVDAANLRSAVRVLRMHKGQELLRQVLLPGGEVSLEAITAAVLGETSLAPLFPEILEAAALLGDEAARGGTQTAFERACDDAVNAYLQKSAMEPFGDGVLISYLAAVENDITAARVILSGRLSGVPADAIRERLRESYV